MIPDNRLRMTAESAEVHAEVREMAKELLERRVELRERKRQGHEPALSVLQSRVRGLEDRLEALDRSIGKRQPRSLEASNLPCPHCGHDSWRHADKYSRNGGCNYIDPIRGHSCGCTLCAEDIRDTEMHRLLADARAIRNQRWDKAKEAEQRIEELERTCDQAHRDNLNLAAENQRLEGALEAEREQKNKAYSERNIAVVALARMALRAGHRAGLILDREAEHGWRHVVAVDLPTGQVTWHLPDREAQWAGSLPYYEGQWDGHDTEEKHRRCLAFAGTAFGREDSEGDLIELLAKLDSGEGGRRTGKLKRRGWLRWEVTKEGKEALGTQAQPARFVRTAAEIDAATSMSRHGRDYGDGKTLGAILKGLADRIDEGQSGEEVAMYLNDEFLYGAWGKELVGKPIDMLRDLRGAIVEAYRLGEERANRRNLRDASETLPFTPQAGEEEYKRELLYDGFSSALGREIRITSLHPSFPGPLVEVSVDGDVPEGDGPHFLPLASPISPAQMQGLLGCLAHRHEAYPLGDVRAMLAGGKYTRWAADYTLDEMTAVFWLVGEMRARLMPRDFSELYGRVSPGAHVRSVVAAAALVDRRIDQPRMTTGRVRWLMRKALQGEVYVDEVGWHHRLE